MGSYTPKLNLYKPDPEETAWASDINNNFDIIDSVEFHLEDDASVYKQSGTASAGTSTNSARSDHVHPAGETTWENISGKPSSFTPSTHAATHQKSGTDELSLHAGQITTGTNTAFNKNFETDSSKLKTPGTAAVGTLDTVARRSRSPGPNQS